MQSVLMIFNLTQIWTPLALRSTPGRATPVHHQLVIAWPYKGSWGLGRYIAYLAWSISIYVFATLKFTFDCQRIHKTLVMWPNLTCRILVGLGSRSLEGMMGSGCCSYIETRFSWLMSEYGDEVMCQIINWTRASSCFFVSSPISWRFSRMSEYSVAFD